MKSAVFLCALSVILAGCGMGPRSYTDKPPAPAGSPAEQNWPNVKAVNLQQLNGEYEIVGEIYADPLLHNMIWAKKQAARLGADAISVSDNVDVMKATKYYAIVFKHGAKKP